ncbi:MAG: GGDEF domain-containing protein [Firmicutes bacterium]|nr:GGDEF domain-containing protein [Bacillota bacterium]
MPTPGPSRPSPALSRIHGWLAGSILVTGLLLGGGAVWAILGISDLDHVRLWEALVIDTGLFTILMLGLQWVVWHRLVAFWQRRAIVDDLTGLLRRETFWVHSEAAVQMRGQRPWVMMYTDLDDFKQINDQYGHGTGDAVLQTWGRILRDQARQADHLSRLGGEEVGWWLPQTTCEEARIAVERVLWCCQMTPVDLSPVLPFPPA